MVDYSVIIPTFNGAKTINQTLNSLARQSVAKSTYEIIVIDDGSTDETAPIIRSFQKKNPRMKIKYFYQPNQGATAARNSGIREASGQIVFFTDCDCELPALWLEKIIAIYKEKPYIVGVGGWYQPPLIKLRHQVYHQFIYLYYRYNHSLNLDFFSGDSDTYLNLKSANLIRSRSQFIAFNTANISFKKWLFNSVGQFDPRLYHLGMEDYELTERIIKAGFTLYYLPLPVLDLKEVDLKRFLKICIARARGTKAYRQLTKNIPYGLEFSPWTHFVRFKKYCQYLEADYPGFKVKKNLFLVAFIWFFLRFLILKIPLRPKMVS